MNNLAKSLFAFGLYLMGTACSTKDPGSMYCHVDKASHRATLYSDQPGKQPRQDPNDDAPLFTSQPLPKNQVDTAGKTFFPILTVLLETQEDDTLHSDQVIFPFGKKARATFAVDADKGICRYIPDLAILPDSTYQIHTNTQAIAAVADKPTVVKGPKIPSPGITTKKETPVPKSAPSTNKPGP